MIFALLLALLPLDAWAFSHGWGSVGDMLAGDFGTHSSARYDLSAQAQPNWEWLANNYAALTINGFGTLRNCGEQGAGGGWTDAHRWNCSGESTTAQAARILKKINPKIKILWYQPSSAVDHGGCKNQELHDHPGWWLRDDHGNLQPQGAEERGCIPGNVSSRCNVEADWRVKAARDWWVHAPLREVIPQSDAKGLIDGVFCGGSGYHNTNSANISETTYRELFAAKMQMLHEANLFYGQ